MEKEKENSKLEIIYVTSPWCGPCKMQTPIVEKLKEKYRDSVIVKDISIPENMEWATAKKVMSTPAIIVGYEINEGEATLMGKTFSGLTPLETIIKYIEDGK